VALTDICLDTSAYSHLRRGSTTAVEAVRRARRVVVPVIVLGELRAGFLGEAHQARNLTELAEFLAHPVVSVADVDARAAEAFASLVDEARRVGAPVPTNDLWIAAIALVHDLTIVTCDTDFLRIRRVAVTLVERA